MLHAQDSHAIEPHCSHRFPAANDETDRSELKLVTFVCPTSARKTRLAELRRESL
jgi:hypothetical protein